MKSQTFKMIDAEANNDLYLFDNWSSKPIPENAGTSKTIENVFETIEASENLEAPEIVEFSGIFGTPKNDKLKGTDQNDVLYGLAGNDRLAGGRGDDKLIGGDGNDRLVGGAGDDILIGFGSQFYLLIYPPRAVGQDSDTLKGGKGADTFVLGTSAFANSFYSQKGHATVEDFKRSQNDKIQILGELDEYRLVTRKNYGGSSKKDTAIFQNKNLITIVHDVTNLNAQDFASVAPPVISLPPSVIPL